MYLFDTNVLSEVLKKKPDPSLLPRLARIPGNKQFTSCICVMELRYGSSRRPDHKTFWDRIPEDLLIAATALNGNLKLITANERHFKQIDKLKLENWLK